MDAIVKEIETGLKLAKAMVQKADQAAYIIDAKYSGESDSLNTLTIRGRFAGGLLTDDAMLNRTVSSFDSVAASINQQLGPRSVSIWTQHQSGATGYKGFTVYVRPDRAEAALKVLNIA